MYAGVWWRYGIRELMGSSACGKDSVGDKFIKNDDKHFDFIYFLKSRISSY